jgi:hypothetical protein
MNLWLIGGACGVIVGGSAAALAWFLGATDNESGTDNIDQDLARYKWGTDEW